MSPSNNASNDASKPVSNNNGDTNSKHASKIAVTTKTVDNNQPKVTVSGSHSSHNSSSNKSSSKAKSNSLSLSALSQKLHEPFKNSYSYHERWSVEDSQNNNEASLHSVKESALANPDHTTIAHEFDFGNQVTNSTGTVSLIYNLSSPQAATIHPNFDIRKTPIDPDSPLSRTASLDAKYERYLQQLLTGKPARDTIGEHALPERIQMTDHQSIEQTLKQFSRIPADLDHASPWALIASPELASHLELLQLGGLIDLPKSFFDPVEPLTHRSMSSVDSTLLDNSTRLEKPTLDEKYSATNVRDYNGLLVPLTDMPLLDLSDIFEITRQHPTLTRYGFVSIRDNKYLTAADSKIKSPLPELINDIFSPTWEVVLHPERFDNGIDSLSTDILACSVAVHILKQCQTRKTVNRRLSVAQICQYMRSYVLSQCNLNPQFESQYRQIRLFIGHVIVAANYLGLRVSHNQQESSHINVSSKSALFTRYPDLSQYYLNGWR